MRLTLADALAKRLTALLLAALPLSSSAVLLTTRTAWEDALAGSFITEDFNSTPDVRFVDTPSVALADFSVTADAQHSSATGISGGRLGADLHSVLFGGPPYFLRFNFAQPVAAFAMDLSGVGNDMCIECLLGGISINFNPSFSSSYENFFIAAGTSFFGFISDTGATFSSITLTKPVVTGRDERDHFSIDNVSYAYSVPEPPLLGLVALALGCMVGALRSKPHGRRRIA